MDWLWLRLVNAKELFSPYAILKEESWWLIDLLLLSES